MSAEIINLRRARKARHRRDAEVRAAENRVAFGRTKAERQATDAANQLEARRLDGLQLDRDTNAAREASGEPADQTAPEANAETDADPSDGQNR